MDYTNVLIIMFAGMTIVLFILNIINIINEEQSSIVWIFMTEFLIVIVVSISVLLFFEPGEENYSKKEILKSQKIEAILDSDVEPIENGQHREAISKDYDAYKGTITYTSDKKLDKTYQKVRYYSSFFYKDDAVIYLYDPEKS